MIIRDERTKGGAPNIVEFCVIRAGKHFLRTDTDFNEHLYFKTSDRQAYPNAFSCEDDCLVVLGNDEDVIPVSAELVIKD